MVMCCQSNSTFLIFAVLVCDVGRIAIEDFLKLLRFFTFIIITMWIHTIFGGFALLVQNNPSQPLPQFHSTLHLPI